MRKKIIALLVNYVHPVQGDRKDHRELRGHRDRKERRELKAQEALRDRQAEYWALQTFML